MPAHRPVDPCFGSGPTRKRPGWSITALEGALTGRSHRSSEAKSRLAEVIERSGYRAMLDNTLLLPHIGSATVETRDAMGFCCLDNLDAFFAGRPCPTAL